MAGYRYAVTHPIFCFLFSASVKLPLKNSEYKLFSGLLEKFSDGRSAQLSSLWLGKHV